MPTPEDRIRKFVQRYKVDYVNYVADPDEKRRCISRFLDRIMRNKRNTSTIAYDIESTGIDPFAGITYRHDTATGNDIKCVGSKVFGITIVMPHHTLHDNSLLCPIDIVWARVEDPVFDRIRDVLATRRVAKVAHNAKFDTQMCWTSGIEVLGDIYCTLVMSRLTHDRIGGHSLKYLGLRFSGEDPKEHDDWSEIIKNWLKRERSAFTRAGYPKDYINYSHVPVNMMRDYAWADGFYGWLCYARLLPEIKRDYWEIYNTIEMPACMMAMHMERRGVKIDRKSSREQRAKAHDKARRLERSLQDVASSVGHGDFNPGSPKQVLSFLKAAGVPENVLQKNGRASVEAKILAKVAKTHPRLTCVSDLLDMRSAVKLGKTYFDSFLKRSDNNGILHCNLKPSDTATGRFACAQPNLQNIPRTVHEDPLSKKERPNAVREVFVPRDGYKNWYFDYSQVELRGFATLCGETSMLDAFERGEDIHMFTARIILGEATKLARFKAKAVNFGIIYGMGIAALGVQIDKPVAEARRLYDLYYAKFSGVRKLTRRCSRDLRTQGYVEDLFGRRYHIPYDKAYIAVNSIVQGMCAMILKKAMIKVQAYIETLSIDICILLCVHDELIIEIENCHSEVEMAIAYNIKKIMEDIPEVTKHGMNPLVEVACSSTNWSDKEGVSFGKTA